MINSVSREIFKKFNINKYAETGILNGDSILIVQDYFCNLYPTDFNTHCNASTYSKYKMYACDIDVNACNRAVEIAKSMNNIIIKCDYSYNFLKYLLQSEFFEDDNCFLFLDAHPFRGERKDMLLPLQQEMKILSKSKLKNCIISIDDWKVEGKRHDHYSEEDIKEFIKDRTDVVYHSRYPNIHKKYSSFVFLDKYYDELQVLLKDVAVDPVLVNENYIGSVYGNRTVPINCKR